MIISKLHQLFLESAGVCTDTRKIQQNQVFFALKGDNFDGNSYAQQALKDGASLAIVDDETVVLDQRYILVDDVLTCL